MGTVTRSFCGRTCSEEVFPKQAGRAEPVGSEFEVRSESWG